MIDYTEGAGCQYHIGLKPGEVGPYVFLTGDPGRVKDIAAGLDEPHYVTTNREYVTWTGSLAGKPVSVMSTGIGGPSTAIAVEELFHLGCHTLIRLGTCGGMDQDVKGGDLVIASGAVRMEGTTQEYVPIEYPAVPDHHVVCALEQAAVQMQVRYHIGVVQCKDAFYGQHEPEKMPGSAALIGKWNAYLAMGTKASEMESAALFIVGQARGLRTGSILHCIANQERARRGLPNDQDHDLQPMFDTAILAMKQLIKNEEH
ncbi:uridine phosphorylase [Catenisphaera adipataccumulans]|jgi:uridine phosphorylase|uniref:Uridine phosphorylase n=1 Tax=Catenisphaera adipataccumulans TaxID=700500 RepID=A0A7W8FVP3_9FIRM|nr:uridine phosphorylase [Catenisphaera adipataccumulans]MBB5182426.1 uridine phosphorylase [Catenisphaera adipataccumulans]